VPRPILPQPVGSAVNDARPSLSIRHSVGEHHAAPARAEVTRVEEGLGSGGVMALHALDASCSSASPLSSSQRPRTQPPTGLFSWIMTAKSSSTEGAVYSGMAPSSPLEAAVAAAREVLEIGARAATDAEVQCGKASDSVSSPTSVATSASAAGKSAIKAARFAMEAMLAATAGGDDGRVVGGVGGGAAVDVRMLSALAPLVEKVVATQRSQWTLQVRGSVC